LVFIGIQGGVRSSSLQPNQIFPDNNLSLSTTGRDLVGIGSPILTRHTSRVPDNDHFQFVLLGKISDEIFRTASVDFIKSLIKDSSQNAILNHTLRVASLLWLPIFESARKRAWKEALLSISTGFTINRYEKCGLPPAMA